MSDERTQRRAQKIINSIPSIKSRIGSNEVRSSPQRSGHAFTEYGGEGNPITINSTWAEGVTDKRLQATLYHESMHVQQHEDGMTGQSLSPLREFHAHNRELRHAMKHNLYSHEDMVGKLKKINKYAGKVKTAFPHLSDNVERQLGRIRKGKKPAKHSVSYWTKRVDP
ncbi:hypothetical protein AB835_00495 [Candidatus Endobugula sertula]|uniref:Tox-MPTase4 domain-containing protein n=1 Tax=Candidatus Endobugula sertula TaxID=62101 RepID=A0A1D2QTW9_9GAMM|nr:hypothetical protein AB835_00495 [Candidatus Endobugula sertula]